MSGTKKKKNINNLFVYYSRLLFFLDIFVLFLFMTRRFIIYSRIFLSFWLGKIPGMIHHVASVDQYGRILRYVKNDVNCAA